MNQQYGNQMGQRGFVGGAGNMNQGGANPFRGAAFGGTSMGMGMMSNMGGNMANQGNFGSGMSANFGNPNQGGFGQMGMSQGVSQQQLNQIHQNSLFNGASQPDNMQVGRIHQATISGEEANPFRGAGFGDTSMGMMGGMGGNMANQGNFNSGMSANFGNQNQGGYGQMGMGVSQQQLNQIHQNSLFNGASQPDNMQVGRIHQATISGEEANPFRGAGFGGTSMGMMGGAGSMGMMSSMGGNMANQGNFGSGMPANFGSQNQGGFGQMGMGMSQGVSQQQLNQIHQNSIFNGASQLDNAQVQRIHQATLSGEEMNPLSNAFGGGYGGGFGGSSMSRQGQGFVNPSALNSVLNADAGIRDQQGPNSYPASMFTGSNQYDNVNQSAFNQMNRSF